MAETRTSKASDESGRRSEFTVSMENKVRARAITEQGDDPESKTNVVVDGRGVHGAEYSFRGSTHGLLTLGRGRQTLEFNTTTGWCKISDTTLKRVCYLKFDMLSYRE